MLELFLKELLYVVILTTRSFTFSGLLGVAELFATVYKVGVQVLLLCFPLFFLSKFMQFSLLGKFYMNLHRNIGLFS